MSRRNRSRPEQTYDFYVAEAAVARDHGIRDKFGANVVPQASAVRQYEAKCKLEAAARKKAKRGAAKYALVVAEAPPGVPPDADNGDVASASSTTAAAAATPPETD